MAPALDAITDKQLKVVPVHGCAQCMFAFFSCGTGFSFKIHKEADDKISWVDNTVCFCLSPSPCPCAPYCGFGPLAQKPTFTRDASDPTKWNGTGESIFAGKCCAAMFHNKGDVMVYSDEHDGSSKEKKLEFHSGNSPVYPPCLQNVHVADAYIMSAGAPDTEAMQR